MSVVEVHSLRRCYGADVAVEALDLTVAAGECLAMLGPNGAGKTTTVEILEGYRHRDAGDVMVLGQDPARPSRAWRQKIGIVVQSVADLGDATVREALKHFSTFYDVSRPIDETIELVGLADKAAARVSTLSGGQRRRLDVALGVVGRPQLLFLDEPTTGFDPEARRHFWSLIERLKGEGVTIVLTTHYLEEADALADRVVVIARGRKLADTTPAQLGARSGTSVRVRWREKGELREQLTSEPTALVNTLAQQFGGEVPALEVSRTTLEEAYLALIAESTGPS